MSKLFSRNINLIFMAVCLPLIIGCNSGGGGSGSGSTAVSGSTQALSGMSRGSSFTLEQVQEFLILTQGSETKDDLIEIPNLDLLEKEPSFTQDQDVVSTPEPTTMILLGGGLIAMSRRRRTKR